jgi:hypothetical protein
MHRFFVISSIILLGGLGGFLYYALHNLSPSDWQKLSQEDSLIELSAIIAFGFTALLMLIRFIGTKTKMDFIFMTLMVLAAAREMDLHKKWTTDSILKSRFYIDPETPQIEKVIGAVLIFFLIYAAFQLVKRVPTFITDLWRFKAESLGIAMGLGILVLSKVIDSKSRLPYIGDVLSDFDGLYLGLVEETFETAAAGFFIIVAVMMLQRRW